MNPKVLCIHGKPLSSCAPGHPDPSRYKRDTKPGPSSYGSHEPTECHEGLGHGWERTFKCPICLTTYYEPIEEMRETDGLTCYGDGYRVSREEPNE